MKLSELVSAALVFTLCLLAGAVASQAAEKGELVFQSLPQAQYRFDGLIGQRISANVQNWLLSAPIANPGMLEMFRVRDRHPIPKLVPWAGEFVWKYLISAIQVLRMTNEPQLRELVARVVKELITSQASDGYLGPFPSEARLKGNWDLWGHYHCLMALLMWHEATGDESALKACQRAADLACATFLDAKLRVRDAGSPEMNMAIIHSLGWLYRITNLPRYLRLMREIEKDWESAGDYFRTGLAGVEFFKTPKPRWESLHDLQGLVELYRITGDTRYRTAFTNHWRSIRHWDRRNTGGFSSGEQATGNPYAPTAIETCCTIAWMALTIDMLQLTGESLAADELELSALNGALGAQHPSGRWWTYNTPMDGAREASAHSIVFQARAGTPELNCCSVNGPRGLGSLSEWAVMKTSDGLAVNYYGSCAFQGKLADSTPIALQMETDYPLSRRVEIRVEPLASRQFNLRLRIPAWSKATNVRLNRIAVTNVVAGHYLQLNRRWRSGDLVTLDFDLQLRIVPGDKEASGKVSIYHGPLLLAFDPKHNDLDDEGIPALDLQKLGEAEDVFLRRNDQTDPLLPWILVEVPAKDGRRLRLCDFASAGATGTRYRSWLPVAD
ncbi:MAG: glycoside hydrolase family 127 protein [Verrucomicrobia bacterium]|nr:glycoside hydrolase family 127 protein [Verrucomicrobiota bacterium]